MGIVEDTLNVLKADIRAHTNPNLEKFNNILLDFETFHKELYQPVWSNERLLHRGSSVTAETYRRNDCGKRVEQEISCDRTDKAEAN